MEDADSDSGFDSDGDWYHAGRDIVYGLRTNSHAVGPDGEEKGRHPVGMPLFLEYFSATYFEGKKLFSM
jgi:hypothetical protein